MKYLRKNFMEKFLKRLFMRHLRWALRGHRMLKKTDSQRKIYEVMQAVSTTELWKNKVYSKIIFGSAVGNPGLVIRQYLITRTILGTKFSKSLLYSLGKPRAAVLHPLPPEWREVVKQHGFKVPKFRSALVWNAYVFIFFIHGILSIGKKVVDSIKVMILSPVVPPNEFVFFDGLTVGNIPQSERSAFSYDIISWYERWSGRVREIDAFCHDVQGIDACRVGGIPVVWMPYSVSLLAGSRALMRYIGWSFAATFITIVDFFQGRWWHALLLKEASLAAEIRVSNSHNLARDYLFHNSHWAYRPLWTYEAEKRGARITFYFYSANCDALKRPDGYQPIYFGYQTMNWPHYLVWDAYQADFVHRSVGENANVSVVGPIWFYKSKVEIQKLPPQAIAVFDIQPFRDAFYQSLGIDFDYYTPQTAIQFLSDIYTILAGYSCTLVLKRKRNIGQLVHPKYRQFAKNLDELPNFLSIDHDTSAIELIKECKAAISMPFTSTALLGRELGKPSIYYDPHGLIQTDDRCAHGIEIICGQLELKAWVANIVNSEVMNEKPGGEVVG